MTRRPRLPQRSALARRGLAGAAAALLLLTAAACGGGDDEGGAEAAPTTSATESPEETSETPEAPEATETPADDGEVASGEPVDPEEFATLFRDAVSQETTARLGIVTSSSAGGLEAEGDVDLGTTPPSLALTLSLDELGQGEIETRLVDGRIYLKSPQLGDDFFAFDLDDPNNPLGASFTDLFDIGFQVDTLADATEEVVYVGAEEVDGEELERYTVTVDAQALADVAGPAAGVDPSTETVVYDVYLDDEGLLRRLTFEVPEADLSSTITYSDWGKDVRITAPRPNQVTSLPGAPG